MENYIPNISKDDVILPLYTEDLRQHLAASLYRESHEAANKMKDAGWGTARFGQPNPEFYGDYTEHFYNYFWGFLDRELNVVEGKEMSGKFYMRVGEINQDSFTLIPLNCTHGTIWGKYFNGFRFSIKNYGKDFYKMGHN